MNATGNADSPRTHPCDPPSSAIHAASESDENQPNSQQKSDFQVLMVISSVGFVVLTCMYLKLALTVPEPPEWISSDEGQPFVVEMNTAHWVEWLQLEGIGPKTAFRIVADRDLNGPFEKVEDLLRVDGIGPKTLERIRPMLRISHSTDLNPGNQKSE